ncbi:MAG TPA: sugar ABC transporter substrate-binding protein, partial [Isosphaeraceae bacterium]
SWSDAVDRTVQAARVVVGLRIPGTEGYLADLSKGRVAAADGQAAEQALKGVSDAWDARTRSLGPKRQLWHYRRSLVRLVTAPEPPSRGE